MAVPSETPQSSTAPTPAAVDSIATRTFSTSFRGWDPDEVRVHLVQVAETVRALTHRQSELQRQLAEAEAAARRADLTELDVDQVSQVLGEETARVLRTARESAAEIRAKAEERVALLSRQAAEDAAKSRETTLRETEAMRRDSLEEASATRSAGEAYVAELQAEAEAEIAAERQRVDEELAALQQAVRDEVAQVAAEADEAAATIRHDAAEDAARVRSDAEAHSLEVRSEADRYAEQVRADADAVLAERIAAAESEAARVRAEAQVAADELRAAATAELDSAKTTAHDRVEEAERVRERVLADLARKRKAARQHLEQLRAGRDRLVEAFDAVRVTTDNATHELSAVLPDAKRVANEAARRVASEPDQSVADIEAEIALAHEANLPLVAPPTLPTAESDSDEVVLADDEGAEEAATDRLLSDEPDVDATDASPEDESVVDAPLAEAAEAVATPRPPISIDSSVDSPPPPMVLPVRVADDDARAHHRKGGRRFLHRGDDPLGGESLPEVPMEPVVPGADFEAVRVVTSDESGDESAPADDTADDGEQVAAEGEATDGLTDSGDGITEADAEVEEDEVAPAVEERADEAPDTADSVVRADVSVPPKPRQSAAEAALSAVAARAETPADTSTHDPVAVSPGEKGSDAEQPTGDADIDGIFERLRRERGGGEPNVAAGGDVAEEAESGDALELSEAEAADDVSDVRDDGSDENGDLLAGYFEKRDAAVDAVTQRLAKKLKRVLSDEQSALLDGLRRTRKRVSADELLPSADDQVASMAEAATEDLHGAVVAGVLFAGDLHDDAAPSTSTSVDEVAAELAQSVVGPLRIRLRRALGDDVEADDDDPQPSTDPVDELELADRIRYCYREWRGTRLTDVVADACATAFARAMRDALPSSVDLVWQVDHGDHPCPDCADNVLAGPVAMGEPFPTGQTTPPAHPGCRCLVLPPELLGETG